MGAGVEADGQGFGEGGVGEAEAGRQLDGLGFGAGEDLAEAALDVREAHRAAEEAHVEAVPRLALEAVFAVAAGVAGVDGHFVADGDAGDLGPDRRDFAGDLVAWDQRLADADRAEAAVLIIMKVGAADAAVADADVDVARAEGRVVDLADAEVAGAVDDGGAHHRTADMPPST